MSVKLVSAAASHVGKVRSANQDSGYSGYQLFFVADGMMQTTQPQTTPVPRY